MAYHFYLGNMLCPVAPSKLQMKIGNKNKVMTLIDQGEVTILKTAGLTESSFDLLLPNVQYPFATYKSGFVGAKYFLNELEKLKIDKKPFQFIVTRVLPNGEMLFDTNIKVSLETYDIKEDAKQAFDVIVTVKLKQYRDYGTKTYQFTSDTTVSVETTRETTNSPAPSTVIRHEVKRGEHLWLIAAKYYGDGGLWKTIYEANRDVLSNPNSIPVGKLLIIPKLE